MRSTNLLLMVFLCLLLHSCSKEENTSLIVETMTNRTSPNMMVAYLDGNGNTVTVQSSSIEINYANANYLLLTLYAGLNIQQVVSTSSVNVYENDQSLKITTNDKVSYVDKSSFNTSIGSGTLQYQINQGQIAGSSSSIVIEESDIL